jgi:hypothetical protein
VPHSVNQLTTAPAFNGAKSNVKQEGNAPLTAMGTDHQHHINSFSTLTGDHIPEHTTVLFLCR